MNAVGNLAQRGDNFRSEPKLGIERESGAADAGVGQRGHAHSAARHAEMIIAQHGRGAIVFSHTLEGCRTDSSVAERHRTYIIGSEE